MSFWQADTKLAIGQKSVAIPAEVHGQYDENNKIIIKVDPSTEFFLRRNLKFVLRRGRLVAVAPRLVLSVPSGVAKRHLARTHYRCLQHIRWVGVRRYSVSTFCYLS